MWPPFLEGWSRAEASTRLEMPKSEILMLPLLSTRTLAPLMSRWMMSRPCKYESPVRICRTKFRMRGS